MGVVIAHACIGRFARHRHMRTVHSKNAGISRYVINAVVFIQHYVGEQVHQSNTGWSPVYIQDNLAVMSVGFLLKSHDEAVIWRGPKKNGKFCLRDFEFCLKLIQKYQ